MTVLVWLLTLSPNLPLIHPSLPPPVYPSLWGMRVGPDGARRSQQLCVHPPVQNPTGLQAETSAGYLLKA